MALWQAVYGAAVYGATQSAFERPSGLVRYAVKPNHRYCPESARLYVRERNTTPSQENVPRMPSERDATTAKDREVFRVDPTGMQNQWSEATRSIVERKSWIGANDIGARLQLLGNVDSVARRSFHFDDNPPHCLADDQVQNYEIGFPLRIGEGLAPVAVDAYYGRARGQGQAAVASFAWANALGVAGTVQGSEGLSLPHY